MAEAAGFTVFAAPSLEIMPCDFEDLERLLGTIKEGDIVVFTSATSAEECGRSEMFRDSLFGTKVLSIGPGTADALERLGVATDIMPLIHSSEGIVEHMKFSVAGKRVVLLRSDHGSSVLDEGLRAAGADVVDFIAYSLKPADPRYLDTILEVGKAGKIDVFAFTSPLSAKSFIEAAEENGIDAYSMLRKAVVAAIGKPTVKMLASFGIRADVVPDSATFEEMLRDIKKGLS
jgi:uroporphyrinogen-III synthase